MARRSKPITPLSHQDLFLLIGAESGRDWVLGATLSSIVDWRRNDPNGVPVSNHQDPPGGEKKSFLIIGKQADPCCGLVAEYIQSNAHRVLLLPESDLFPRLGFSWMPPSGGTITWNDVQLSLSEIAGVLYRGDGRPVTSDEYQTSEGRYLTAEWNALTMAWLDRMPCPVVNRLKPELWYRPRLNVADLATVAPSLRELLPPMLVTTQRDEIRRFWAAHPGDMFYTPLTSCAEYPVRNDADLDSMETLCGALPVQLIKLEERARLNCFVTADDVVFLGNDGAIAQPPSSDLTLRCIAAGKALGILFYKLSLVARPRGGWYCIGLDRLPSLNFCSSAARQQIAINLGRVMSGGGR
jgi:hypothetical protein